MKYCPKEDCHGKLSREEIKVENAFLDRGTIVNDKYIDGYECPTCGEVYYDIELEHLEENNITYNGYIS